MKIGIITYWQSNDNYGQQLQCWALQQYLKKLGHKPFLIRFKRFDWRTCKRPAPTTPSLCVRLKVKIKRIIKHLLVYPIIRERKAQKIHEAQAAERKRLDEYANKRNVERKFPEFRAKHLSVSEMEYKDVEELRANPPLADAYITGSDQVWNYDLQPEELDAFFLQWGEKSIKRISYAPSIGHNTWPEELQYKLKSYLSTFDAISVREASAQDICKNVGYEATHVLDPTLLLSANDYGFGESTQEENPFIYIYSLNYQTQEDIPWQEIKQYAQEHNLRIKVTPGSGYTPCREIFDGVEYEYSTIPQWINNIKKAKLVITASFHGTVFAILNHTKVIFTPLKGKIAQSNARGEGLLKMTNLEQFIIQQNSDFNKLAEENINWTNVDSNLNDWRMKSYNYLKNNL